MITPTRLLDMGVYMGGSSLVPQKNWSLKNPKEYKQILKIILKWFQKKSKKKNRKKSPKKKSKKKVKKKVKKCKKKCIKISKILTMTHLGQFMPDSVTLVNIFLFAANRVDRRLGSQYQVTRMNLSPWILRIFQLTCQIRLSHLRRMTKSWWLNHYIFNFISI